MNHNNEFINNIFYFFIKEKIENKLYDFELYKVCRYLNRKFKNLITQKILYFSYSMELMHMNQINPSDSKESLIKLFYKEGICDMYSMAVKHIKYKQLPLYGFDEENNFTSKRLIGEIVDISNNILFLPPPKEASSTKKFSLLIPHTHDLFQYVLFKEKPSYVKFYHSNECLLNTITKFRKIVINNIFYYYAKLSEISIPITALAFTQLYIETDISKVYLPLFQVYSEERRLLASNSHIILLSNGLLALVRTGMIDLLR
jgi:hypothetical protein